MKYTAETLLRRPKGNLSETVTRVTASDAGWTLLNMEVRRLEHGARWCHETGDNEVALVVLGGRCTVVSDKGRWEGIGRRPNVFAGMPYALYLPRRTSFVVESVSEVCEVAHCWVPTDEDHPPQLVTPTSVAIELRGGNQASRQINSIIPPGFDCHRIVCVEVYTPGGNWSSYPPHKHDERRSSDTGELLEAELEEFYYYKLDKPGGYAIQRVYTDDRRIDSAVVAHSDDIVLVPAGYHPVSAPYGFNCYYLNFLAGTAQSLACSDDPAYAWIKETWTGLDPRVPMVTRGMEPPEER